MKSMHRCVIPFILSASVLSACTTLPKSSTLMEGIDPASLQQPDATQKTQPKLSTDPVCTQFYENAIEYAQAAAKPNSTSKFLTSTGISVLAAVATNGLFTGAGGVGQAAARTATSAAVHQGGKAAISGLDPKKTAHKNIIDKAEEIGCPVNVI